MSVHRSVIAVTALAVAGLVGGLAPSTAGAAPYCGITWGSLNQSSPEFSGALIRGARTGRQDCYDRLVIDLNGMPAPGYNIRYTDAFRDQGGFVRPTSGGQSSAFR